MTRHGKADSTVASTEVVGKLGRLLQTEAALEAMLHQTKQQAQEIVDTARREADAQVRRFESHVESEHRQLRERIERGRDQTIASIRHEAELETRRLSDVDEERLRRLAQHVVDILLGRSEGGGLP